MLILTYICSIIHSVDVIAKTNQQDTEADSAQPRRWLDFLNRQCNDVDFEECRRLNDQDLSEMASELLSWKKSLK